MSQSIYQMKKVYIVGTGVAGALIAKTLTDMVYDKFQQKFILRNKANHFFKEVLEKIEYFKPDQQSIEIDLNFFAKIKTLDSIYQKEIASIVKKLEKQSDQQQNKYHAFETALFNFFFSEIAITMFEAGLSNGVKLDSSSSALNYNAYMAQFNQASAKVPNSPFPKLKQADSPNVLDIEKIPTPNPSTKGYLVQKGPLPFLSDHIRVGGGTTLHWLGSTPRMLPNDFKLSEIIKDKYDQPQHLAWPIQYEDLKPYYEIAEYEIGVSGNTQTQAYPNISNMQEYYGADYEFPMQEIPQSYMDQAIIKGLQQEKIHLNGEAFDILLNSTPQGRNSTPSYGYKKSLGLKFNKTQKTYTLSLKDSSTQYTALGAIWNPYMGERCEGNASCVPICPVQAKYNALKSLKKAFYKMNWRGELKEHPFINIQAQSVVYRLNVGEDDRIADIYLRRYDAQDKTSFQEQCIHSSDAIVILAANALENPKILLNSKVKNKAYSTAANSSDQVGRNLMDHQVMLTWGLAPQPVYPFRGPGSTTNIASFRDGNFRKDHAAWITPLDNWGWGWPAFAPGSDLAEFLQQGKYGTELRQAIKDRVTRQVLFHFEIEQLPNPENRITISDTYLDVMGIPRPIIQYSISAYEKEGLAQAKKASDQMFELLGIEDHTAYSPEDPSATYHQGQLYNFYGAGHIVGTHRMGTQASNSVTNAYCKAWDHQNLYVVGAGSLPTLGTSNPTLSLAAIAIRSVESILMDLTK